MYPTVTGLPSQATTVAMEMVVPIVAGYFLDQWLGTGFVFVALGAALGLLAGIRGLVSLAQPSRPKGESDKLNGRQPHDKPGDV